MATHKSAVKRHKQSLKHRARNRSAKSSMATHKKKVEQSGSKEDALKNLKAAISAFARAAHKKVIHKNTASRRISLLTRIANRIGG